MPKNVLNVILPETYKTISQNEIIFIKKKIVAYTKNIGFIMLYHSLKFKRGILNHPVAEVSCVISDFAWREHIILLWT